MSDELKITLAGQEYTIRKLTLRMARDLRICTVNFSGSSTDPVDWAAAVVSLALSRDHKEMTPDAILDLEMTEKEIGETCTAVLDFAGFKRKEGAGAPGEARPSESSTGDT